MKRIGRALIVAAPLAVALACGGGKAPAVPLRPPVASIKPLHNAPPPPPRRPEPLAGVPIGAFAEGTFGPRVARNGKRAIVVSAPRADTGRRWFSTELDENDTPIASSKHEIAEAPEDASAWDLKPVGDGFVLAWTRPSSAGEQLLTIALATDGSPRAAPALITKSSDALVAVRLTPLLDGAGAMLTYGEKVIPKGAISASGTLYVLALDALGRPAAPAPTRVAERLSAWQVAASGRDSAVVAMVTRNEPGKADKSDKGDLTPRDEVARAARVSTLNVTPKGVIATDAVTIAADDVLPEIDVVATTPGRALVVWSDRREQDAHLFAQALDVSSGKPKPLGAPKRAVPPRGEQALIALIATRTGAVALWETVLPRSVIDGRRRFDVARLSDDGEALATPRAFLFPYDNDEPELTRAGDDDVALLTYGSACFVDGGAAPTCEASDVRPWVVRLTGPTLTPRQTELVDVAAAGGVVKHAFDLSCTAARCDVLAEGPGAPSTVAIAHVVPREPPALRWVYRELVEPASAPPRLEGATAIGREGEFTGLHVTRAGQGALVGWITYAADDSAVELVEPAAKGKKEPKPKKPKPSSAGGARVAVRLLDGAGDPIGPVTTISERALSKGDVAVAWGEQSGVVAYVSRAEGDEEVYVARVDGKGRKTGGSTRITNAPGTASDVALVALPEGGYLLGWVDGRKNGAAVYAVKLDKSGQKVGAEVKIGGGVAGDLSDLSLGLLGSGASGARVAAVWSDAREDAAHGYADVYFTVVGSKELGKPLVAEKPIARNKTHSHYPVIASRGDGGAVVAWVEDDPSSSEFLELIGRSDWGARVARLDAQGNIVQAATEVPVDASLKKGVATGVSADCASGPSACRVAVAWAMRDGIAVLGSSLTNSGVTPGRVLWSWYGAPSQEVAPAVVGSAVYACEDGLEKDDGRVRRLSVAW